MLEKIVALNDQIKLLTKAIKLKFSTTEGITGQLPFINKDNVSMAFTPAELMAKIRMASTDAEIAAMKSSVQSMADVFTKWKRISHNATGVFPAVPAELNSWAYDATLDTVKMTVNSGSLLGLVSPYSFEEYTFDVVVASADGDDDGIGLILGFKSVAGVEHTLMAEVTTGGLDWNAFSSTISPRLNIVVNMSQGVARGTKLLFTKDLGPGRQNFNGVDFAAGIRIKAIRRTDGTMTVQVMKPDGTNFSGGEVKWTGAIPEMFLGKSPIGYFAYSQNSSTYRNITVPQPKTDIVDKRNLDVHRWNTGTSQWAIVGKADKIIPPGRLYKNTEGTQSSLYMDLEGNFVELTAAGSNVLAVNEYVKVTSNATKQYDLLTLLGSAVSNFDIKTAQISVRVKDTDVTSPLYNVYANAEAVVSYGIKDERYAVVANQSDTELSLYIKISVQSK